MEIQDNISKAREISLEYVETEPIDSCNCSRYGDKEDASYDSALKMAQWKDNQLIELLPKTITCIYQGITQCATDDVIIEEVTNLIKGIKNYSK